MPQERLETIVSAKITDFDAKMGKVLGTLDSVEKKSGMASKKIDSVLKSKSAGTGKAVEVVNAKLKQTEQAANRVSKAMSGVDPKKFEAAQAKVSRVNAQLDAQARKLETLNSQYAAYMSKEKTPASLKAMEKEFAAVAQEIAGVDAAIASLNSRKADLQRNMMMSSGAGDTAGAANYQAQIQALELEEQKLLASTDLLEQKSRSLNAQMASIRMNPAAAAEVQALADKIAGADARMESLSHSASAAKIELDSMGRTSPGLEAVNQKLGKIERSTGRTSVAMGRLNRRFLMLLASKVFSAVFRSLHEGFEGAAKKSDQFKRSLDAVASGGRNIANSIVAAFSPLINIVAPWVTLVAEKIRVLLNRVSMFFAAIAGQKTVMQATQALDEFGSAAETNAAKAQNALAGFDQITKLDTSSGGSSGSGGSKGTDSFEEVAVAETPFSKAISGILTKIGELKGPLQEFYENYIEKFFTWAFDGGGIEGFLDKLKKGIEWFNKNPWAVGVVASLTGLFLAAKVAGGLGALGALGASGSATLGSAATALVVGTLTVMGAVTFFDSVFKTDTLKNVTDTLSSGGQEALKQKGGAKGFLWWWLTGEESRINPETGKAERVKAPYGTPTGSVQVAEQLISNATGISTRDIDYWLQNTFAPIREFLTPGGGGGSHYELTGKESDENGKRMKRAEDMLSAADLYLVEHGYMTVEEAVKKAAKATDKLHHSSVDSTDDILSGVVKLTKNYAGNFVGSTKTASNAFGRVGGASNRANSIVIQGATNAGTRISDAFGGAEALSTDAVTRLERNATAGMGRIAGSAQQDAGKVSSAWIRGWQITEQEVGASLLRLQKPVDLLNSGVRLTMGDIVDSMTRGSQIGAQAAESNFRNMVNRIADYLQRMMTNTRTAVALSFSAFAALPAGLRQYLNISLGSFQLPAMPTLPRFATGGVFDSPTAGIIAEAGREAVLPLDRNTGWMDQLVNKIDPSGGGDVYVTVQNVYDGAVVSEKTTRNQRRASRIHNRPVLA